MKVKPIREDSPPVIAARVIIICGFGAAFGFGVPAFGPSGDMFMKVVTVVLAIGTPVIAYLAARRARRDGDGIGMER